MYTIISGTNRPNNNSLKVAMCYHEILMKKEVASQVLDLQILPSDFIFTASYGGENSDFEEIVDKYVRGVSRFVFVLPEYNGSFPGVLKAFMDCIPPEDFHNKKAALVGLSAGRAGNIRGMDDLTGILHYLHVEVLSKKPKLSVYNKLSDDVGKLNDPETITLLEKHAAKFIDF